MALVRRTPKMTGTKIEGMEEGDYEARLVYIADLGLQEREYKGESKPPMQQIALGMELIGHTVEIEDEMRPRLMWTKPFNIATELSEKGNEIKYYSVFDPKAQPGDVADWDKVLGEPCMVTVVKVERKGEFYDNIGKLTPIPAKYRKDVGDATITPAVGDCEDPDNPVNKALFGLVKYKMDRRITDIPF